MYFFLFFDNVSSGYMPRTRIAGPHGNCLLCFLRSLHTVFHSGGTSLHSHQQCKKVPFSPHPFQHQMIKKKEYTDEFIKHLLHAEEGL